MTDQAKRPDTRHDWCPTCLLVLSVGPSACDDLLAAGRGEPQFLARLRQSREALDQGCLGRCGAENCRPEPISR